jgi:DNA-binding response OmpR family regulator
MPNRIHIVVVEDNLTLQELMVEHISQGGYQVKGMSCADDLDEHLMTNRIDVLVLDLNLPGEDGISIAKRLRASNPNLYIVMLTAKTSENDKVLGYESGADIYLSKPASPIEVTSAISGIERRIISQRQEKSELTLDVQKMQLIGSQGEVHLGASELAILKALIEAPNQRLEYWRLMDFIDNEPTDKTKIALGVQIHRLKKKLMKIGASSSAIKSIHKEGYQLGALVKLI